MKENDPFKTESSKNITPYRISESSESIHYKNIDVIISRWLSLQKILKESQSLEKIIEKQHQDNLTKMKELVHTYYELKIKSRKLYNDIKIFKIRAEGINISNEKEFYLANVEESRGAYFGLADRPIKNIISFIRTNYDYIPILVSLIDENDSKQEVESLAEFFCNQFYTNILIPNPEQEELLICIYKLLEQEINKMDSADIDTFLEDSTFLGKFLTAFSKQPELNNFLLNLLGKVLNEVEKRNVYLSDLSLHEIMNFLKKEGLIGKEKKLKQLSKTVLLISKNFSDFEYIEKILEKIPRTKINFKKQLELEEEILRETRFSNELYTLAYEEDLFYDEEKDQKKDSKYNFDYLDELTKDKLIQKLRNFSDPNLISFYSHLINQLNENFHDQGAFGNQNFFNILKQKDFNSEKNKIIKIYLKGFLFIQEQIEDIIQSLIDKIATIPNSTRCICTMIDILISKKFPLLPKYYRHSFVGKFLFNKCIFPILSLENRNGLKTNVLSKYQVNCLKCIISVISKANKCKLFDVYNDVEKTMFNYYLLEIIPILNSFYDKLVDIKLPNQLNEFIKDFSPNESKNFFLFNPAENQENNIPNNNNKKDNYNYFQENSDEIFRLQSVCFKEMDILFIIKLINKNIDAFKNLPNFDKLKKAIKERQIIDLEETIDELKERRDNAGKFFIMKLIDKNIDNLKKMSNYENIKAAKKEKEININKLEELIYQDKKMRDEMDFLFIIKLISKNIDAFKYLPNFEGLKNAMKENNLKEIEEIIYEAIENSGNSKKEGYYTIFYEEENNLLKELKKIKDKEKKEEKEDLSLLSRYKNSLKIILRRLNLLNIKQYSYLNYATSNENFFHALNCTLRDFEGKENDKGEVPLSWHSKFIVNNKNQLDKIYTLNDFEKIYDELFIEESEFLNKLKSLSPIINARETMNLNCAEIAIENMEYDVRYLEKAKKFGKIKIFIARDKTEVCFNLLADLNKFQSSKTEKDELGNQGDKSQYINVVPLNKCIHRSDSFFAKVQGEKKLNINSHAKNINDFINKIKNPVGPVLESLLNYIKEDIEKGKAKHKIYILFQDYKTLLKESLINNFKDLIENQNETDEIISKIEEYILQKTYKYVFPVNPLSEDTSFYEMTKSYDWIPATYFGVKVDIPLEAIQDSISYIKQMEERAFSVSEKIRCFTMVYNNMKKVNKFYCGITGQGADDITPIFIYIVLKSHPKRLISNINYIKCFAKEESEVSLINNMFQQAIEAIWNITPTSLNISVKEFNRRNSEANERISNLEE